MATANPSHFPTLATANPTQAPSTAGVTPSPSQVTATPTTSPTTVAVTSSPTLSTATPSVTPTLLPPSAQPILNPTLLPTVAGCTQDGDCNLRGYCQSGKCVCYNTNNYWPSDSCSIYHDGPQLYSGQVCNPGLINGHCSWVGTCNALGTACICNDGYHRYPSEACAYYHNDAQPNPTAQPTLGSPGNFLLICRLFFYDND